MSRFFLSFFRIAVILTMTTSIPVFSQEVEYLGPKDVKAVMNQIFDRHINKNEMSEEIMQHALRLYLEQFDPNKIYLLEWEVKPFLNPTPYEMQQYMEAYKQDKLTPFVKLDSLIQKAIYRARGIRDHIAANKEELFNYSPDYRRPYAGYSKQEGELGKRIKDDFAWYIEQQRERFGKEAVDKRKGLMVGRYEKQQKEWENGYLYVNEQGQSYNKDQRTHQFSLHVLKALAKSLDSHTSVLNESEAFNMRSRLLKGYPGTGIEFEQGIDGIIVSKIMPGSPADRAKQIQVHDKLMTIDGKAVNDYTFKHAMEMLEGDAGSIVRLTLKKPNSSAPYMVELKRELIVSDMNRVETSYVPFSHGVIGKITLHSFYDSKNGVSSEQDIRTALIQLRKKGPLKGLILDLRDNSGGYLSQAVKVAGLFITNGVIVVSKYHDGKINYYRDIDGKTYFDGPLVVLISRFTASAAEIVAQALQDYGVAVIVGDDHSYGKGSIQSQTVTGGQNGSYFKVTVGKYYTVSGKTPQVKGVLADVVVPGERTFYDVGERYLDHPLNADIIEPAFTDKLTDIQPEAKPWYFRYYLPTLQPRKTSWQKMIPDLKKKSAQRIQPIVGGGLSPDQQMDEAVRIIKDMIEIHSQLNQDQVGAYE